MYCYVDKLFAYMCQFGYLELVQYLLNKGAEVHKCYYKIDYSTLQLASMNGYEEVVQLLLDHGTNPSMADSSQCTPLHVASRSGHKLVVWLLLNNGADPSVASYDWCTPLHLATKNGCEAVARLLWTMPPTPPLQTTTGVPHYILL
jgi:ankyrin repeat protein